MVENEERRAHYTEGLFFSNRRYVYLRNRDRSPLLEAVGRGLDRHRATVWTTAAARRQGGSRRCLLTRIWKNVSISCRIRGQCARRRFRFSDVPNTTSPNVPTTTATGTLRAFTQCANTTGRVRRAPVGGIRGEYFAMITSKRPDASVIMLDGQSRKRYCTPSPPPPPPAIGLTQR